MPWTTMPLMESLPGEREEMVSMHLPSVKPAKVEGA
jgi:hypothetical protein